MNQRTPISAASSQIDAGADRLSVLHIANSLGTGGAEKFVIELAKRQAKDGHRVTLVCFFRPGELEHGGDLAGQRERELNDAGVQHAYLGASARVNLLAGAWRLRAVAREVKPDLVHCHLLRGSAVLDVSRLGLPSVFTHQNTPIHVSRTAFRLMSRGIDHFVALSSGGRDVLSGLTKRPIDTVMNAIDLSPFYPPQGARPDRPFTTISAGDLREQKNYPYLVRIAAAVRKAMPDAPVHFRIAGEGAERALIEQTIAEHDVGDIVTLLGSRRDSADLMRDADAYLLTSNYEGMPLAVIEAMSTGLPVITTDVGACAELVDDGVNGYLIPEGDPETAAERIGRLIADPEMRARMGERSIERSRTYSIDGSHEGYMKVYRTLLSR